MIATALPDLTGAAVLVANAGVMMTPHLTTVDGFELQLGTTAARSCWTT